MSKQSWLARSRKLFVLPFLVLGVFISVAKAERPVAPKLLPEGTLAYLRIADVQDMVAKFKDTATGRMFQDENIAPLVKQLYGSVEEQWKQIEDQVGLPLNDILKIPQGEICVGVVPMGEGTPAIVIIVDVKDKILSVNKLLEKGEALLTENGGTKTSEVISDVKVNVYTGPGGNTAIQFEKDGTLVLASNKDVVKPLLAAWNGEAKEDEKSLADNVKFNSIMSRCSGSKDERPQITWYVDPVEIARKVLRNGPASLALAFFQPLGLDGVKGMGGSMIFGVGEFDGVTHFHLLLDNPRSGVVELIAMGSGDTVPEAWVPSDVTSYMTMHWRVEDMFKNGNKLWDSLQGEGNFKTFIKERLSDNIGIDVEAEIIPALDGRFTLTQWIEKPITPNSQVNIIGVKLKDTKTFQANVIDKVVAKFPDAVEKKAFGGVTYWAVKMPERPEGGPQPPAGFRVPTPAVAIIGDYVIFTDSTKGLHHCITTTSDATQGLASDLEYKLIAGKIKRQVGGDAPGMVQFSKPEEALRFVYELIRAENTQKGLESASENNDFLKGVNKALKDNPLPAFSVLAKYFAPGGGMIVNDETGYHYMTFTLKRKQ
ncbi:MAG: hypothetical protein ACKVP0_19955 [Pirellulaceae bacterium]